MCPAPKEDKFERFARLAQQGDSSNLVQPQPIPFVNSPCVLKKGTFEPHPVTPDISTKEELYKDEKVIMTGDIPVKADACTAQYAASCEFTAPEVTDREKYSIRTILICNGDFDPYHVVAEKHYEGKRYILSTADLRQENPIAKRFLRNLIQK